MRAPLLAVVVVLSAAGCFHPVEDGASLPFDAWCATREDFFLCDGQAGCGVADPLAHCADVHSGVVGPIATCEPALAQAVDAGRVRYDGTAAAACRQRARTTCDTTRRPWDCDGVFTGTMGQGEPCTMNVECRGGLWCDSSVGTCPGVCAPQRADGAAATSSVQCTSGWLGETPDGGTACAPPPGLGDPCLGELCRPGLACLDGRCVEPVAAGGACDARLCAFGSMCVAGRCTAWAKRGEACAAQFFPVDAGSPPCQLGLACRAGVCGDALRAGESCREEPNRCEGGARCSLSTFLCQRLGAAGAACASVADCDRLACIDGLCRMGEVAGAACDAAHPCVPGLACTDGVCAARVCL